MSKYVMSWTRMQKDTNNIIVSHYDPETDRWSCGMNSNTCPPDMRCEDCLKAWLEEEVDA